MKYKFIIVLALLVVTLILILRRCGNIVNANIEQRDSSTKVIVQVVKDTVFLPFPKPSDSIIYVFKETDTVLMKPSEDYTQLVAQYKELRDELLKDRENLYTERHYSQEFPIDTLGKITIQDTVKNNQIIGRKFISSIKIPEYVKTVTVTKTLPPTTKVFIGGGFSTNTKTLIKDVNAGLGLLTKKDQLFELKARTDFKGNVYGEFNTYWKIHF